MTSRLSARAAATASGIVEVHDGAEGSAPSGGAGRRVIPESRRADGSIRKERRIKPGFVPTEDVARFVPSRVQRAREEERLRKLGQGAAKDTVAADAHTPASSAKNDATASGTQSPQRPAPSTKRDQVEDDKRKTIANPPTTSHTSKVEQSVPDSWDDEDDRDEKDAEAAKERGSEKKSPLQKDTKDGVSSIEGIADELAKLSLPKDSKTSSS